MIADLNSSASHSLSSSASSSEEFCSNAVLVIVDNHRLLQFHTSTLLYVFFSFTSWSASNATIKSRNCRIKREI
ncbi:hypothetical protein HKD37_09G024294 [Glycine soja]